MTTRNREPYDSVLDLIGWTPLVRLNKLTEGCRTPVYAKCEFMNPGGSVKDRIGLAMVEAAEADGSLRKGGTIVEGTGGNTGLALAMVAAMRGYRCICTMPDKMSQEKVKLLRAFGAEVVITPTAVPHDHPEHYVVKAKQIAKDTPGAVVANQFYNPANPEAHYRSTGPELWEQSGGRITHFAAGAGTGGTITGTARYLKEQNPDVQIVGVDPEGSVLAGFFATGEMPEGGPYKVEGLGNDKVPGTLDLSTIDEFRSVSDGDAFRVARRLAVEEGLFVGGSAGLITHAALEVAREIDDPDAFVVTLLCDWGERYLSKLWDDDWMRDNGFLTRPQRSIRDVTVAKTEALRGLVVVQPNTSVRIALSTLATHGISQMPVVRDSESVGAVHESDLMARVLDNPDLLDASVEDVMDAPFPVVDESASVEEVTKLLSRRNAAVLVRTAAGLQGIVTRYDLVRSLTGAA